MELTLTPRLTAVARLVHQAAHLADVGTDHAYLPVRLLLDGRIEYAIAADLREGPLSRARETAARYGVEGRISFRLCDGLSGVGREEVDTVAIAGMGGETIAAILSAAPWTREGTRLLLQPMTSFPDLREWLQKNGYSILREHIVREGKRLYTIWETEGGQMPALSPGELWAGRQSDDLLRGAYLDMIAVKVNRALEGQRASSRQNEEQIAALAQVLTDIQAMRKEL